MSKCPSIILVAVLLTGCYDNPKDGTDSDVSTTSGDIGEELRLLSYPEKLSPCAPFPSSYPPTCAIFQDRFITRKIINIQIIESEKPDNTTCVRTVIINNKYVTQRRQVDGECARGWHER